jgi:hypothetical protein
LTSAGGGQSHRFLLLHRSCAVYFRLTPQSQNDAANGVSIHQRAHQN